MQTVPSLIGTGTAVAAAATGLVFGQLGEGQHLPSLAQTNSTKRKTTTSDRDQQIPQLGASRADTSALPPPLPASDSSGRYSIDRQEQPQHTLSEAASLPQLPRPTSQAQAALPKSSTWRQSFSRPGDFVPSAPIAEDSRDSISSRGSWMRRLSVRPLSQHESLKSSLGQDTPSLFSYGSGNPILPSGYSPPPLPPNKLVKRTSTNNGTNTNGLVRRGSKSQMTLRRPATSHQRSATLHQLTETEPVVPPVPKFSLDQTSRPRAQTVANPAKAPVFAEEAAVNLNWKSYLHSRLTRVALKSNPLRGPDSSAPPSAKRICLEPYTTQAIYLVAPETFTTASAHMDPPLEVTDLSEVEASPQSTKQSSSTPEGTPSKPPRRSISMTFGSPTSWISKTGSIRRRKRGDAEAHGPAGSKRFVSAPNPVDAGQFDDDRDLDGTNIAERGTRAESELTAIFRPPNRQRNSSSPLPPLSRISSFHDLNRHATPSPSRQVQPDERATATSPTTVRIGSDASQARTLERSSTVASSEYHRGFTSGDDDDTDFRTDTPFDSLRTMGSGRRRTVDTPLESMFDESPPSTAGNNKTKRLSIQEILGPSFDGGHKIMEEDEGLSTPVRSTFYNGNTHYHVDGLKKGQELEYDSSAPNFALSGEYGGRLSLDDDDDLDWGDGDDDLQVGNQLSPPSSTNSRKGSPNSRLPLSNISGNSSSDRESTSERPRSNIFQWAESTQPEKHSPSGESTRPRTVHGKQENDMRGGRPSNRKGPVAAHVRSQSVPVVPDPADTAKSTPKFGTWGLGSKNVSEDWDADFEFDEEAEMGSPSGKRDANRYSMTIPASIQATQPTVKAHSGQIRQLSLLVNDLKQLCRLGRELEILEGPSHKIWREAEGIIALASPDEEAGDSPSHPDQASKDLSTVQDERLVDGASDGNALDHTLESGEVSDQIKNAVVRERPFNKRRSVFSPDDDIFGSWNHSSQDVSFTRPGTAERTHDNNTTMADERSMAKLNFDTNSLKELVKRASDLRDLLGDLVNKVDPIARSPARTPRRDRHERADGSPAFTQIYNDPASSPTRKPPHRRGSNPVLNGGSLRYSKS